MDYYFDKSRHFFPFTDLDENCYRTRELVELEGVMEPFDFPNQELREMLRSKKQQPKCKLLIVSASKEDERFLQSGSGFEKKNLKMNIRLSNDEFEISGTLYLTKNNFNQFLKKLEKLRFDDETFSKLSIITIGGRKTDEREIYVEGYCEGLEIVRSRKKHQSSQ